DDDGFDYRWIPIIRSADGQTRAADMVSSVMGEPLSETLRFAILPFVAEAVGGIQSLSQRDRVFIASIPKLHQVNQLLASGKVREALDLIASLPPEFRKEKLALRARIQAASRLGDPEHTNAIRAAIEANPDNPPSDILLFVYSANTGRFDE